MKKKQGKRKPSRPAAPSQLDDEISFERVIRSDERLRTLCRKGRKADWDKEHMITISTRIRAETLAAWTALCARENQTKYARLLKLVMDDLTTNGLDVMPGYSPPRKTAADLKPQWWHGKR